MSDEVTQSVGIVVGLLTIVSIAYGFYKIITDRAKIEADLRNEIKNLKEDQLETCKLIERMSSKFEVVSLRLGDITILEKRANQHENLLERFDKKLDEFSDKLTDIKILLGGKSDRT